MKQIFRYRGVSAYFMIGLVLVLGGWVWAYEALKAIHQTLIIHFNNYAGIDQVGSVANLIPIGVFGIVLTFVNWFISLSLMRTAPTLGKVMTFITLFFDVLIFIVFAAIIGVN